MASETKTEITPRWAASVEKFEAIVVAVLSLLLVIIVVIILAVVIYLFVHRVVTKVTVIENVADLQEAALRGFSGILLVLLGLELLETVKVYFREHTVRVEVILLVGLIAMGRHVLQIDLEQIEPSILLGFSSLLLALAVSYYLVKRAEYSRSRSKEHAHEEIGNTVGDE